ncbi:MAG: NAD(P)-binding protein [Candidatus Moduliflexus flocculans]|nr:NAD(P)-binding protein [Candidatus Moduliflexus flocculans]
MIGAGLGGLMAAAKLARAGKRVVVLEKKALPGGRATSSAGAAYAFPMGPLSFSLSRPRPRAPGGGGRRRKTLGLRRSSFEVRTPGLDVVISRPLGELEAGLARLCPGEAAGLARFFAALRTGIAVAAGADLVHPGFAPGRAPAKAGHTAAGIVDDRLGSIAALAGAPAAAVLDTLDLERRSEEPPRLHGLRNRPGCPCSTWP